MQTEAGRRPTSRPDLLCCCCSPVRALSDSSTQDFPASLPASATFLVYLLETSQTAPRFMKYLAAKHFSAYLRQRLSPRPLRRASPGREAPLYMQA